MSLITPFEKPIYPNTTDLGGDLPTARGHDPLITDGGSSALLSPFDGATGKAVYPDLTSIDETPNPVSGLPKRPERFQPTETPPELPTMETRNPGTIDKK